MVDNIRFVTAWKRNDPKLESDAMEMWREMKVLHPSIRPEDRAKELTVLAYQGERLVGITTSEVHYHEPVRQRLALTRILLRPEAERLGLVVPMTMMVREELREWSKANPQEQVAGWAIVITAKGYGTAPTTVTGLTLIGYTPEGHQIRLYWWDHYRLPVL